MAESPTYSFDPKGREQFIAVMKQYGYMEFPQYKPHLDGFSCYSCKAMRKAAKSPTGFWCGKYKFPDQPHGCCDGYEPVQGLIQQAKEE